MSFVLRTIFGLVALLATTLAWTFTASQPTRAARDPAPVTTPSNARLEILVFEAEACAYCEIFRRDVAPRYRFAPLAAQAPLRFIDISKVDIERMGLTSRLDILPTTVVMKGGREVDRISGLTAAETYFRLLQYMINKNE